MMEWSPGIGDYLGGGGEGKRVLHLSSYFSPLLLLLPLLVSVALDILLR